MITAPYMTDYSTQIRPEYLDKDCWDHKMYSFSLGALDAPDTMAAGSQYWYKGFNHSFVMPSTTARDR